MTELSKCHMAYWMGSSYSGYNPAKFVRLAPCEREDKNFFNLSRGYLIDLSRDS